MKRLILIGLATVLVLPALALAGGAGNPATTIGKENYAVTLEVEEQVKRLDEELVKSRRYVGKAVWGVLK